MASQDAAHVAELWSDTAEAIAEALRRWRGVSSDTDGPLAELHDHALRNAAIWRHEATGKTPSEARRAVDAELGRQPSGPSFINYDPEDEEDQG